MLLAEAEVRAGACEAGAGGCGLLAGAGTGLDFLAGLGVGVDFALGGTAGAAETATDGDATGAGAVSATVRTTRRRRGSRAGNNGDGWRRSGSCCGLRTRHIAGAHQRGSSRVCYCARSHSLRDRNACLRVVGVNERRQIREGAVLNVALCSVCGADFHVPFYPARDFHGLAALELSGDIKTVERIVNPDAILSRVALHGGAVAGKCRGGGRLRPRGGRGLPVGWSFCLQDDCKRGARNE